MKRLTLLLVTSSLLLALAGSTAASTLGVAKAQRLAHRAESRYYRQPVALSGCWRVARELVRCHAVAGHITISNVLWNGQPAAGQLSFIVTVIQHRHCWLVIDSSFLHTARLRR